MSEDGSCQSCPPRLQSGVVLVFGGLRPCLSVLKLSCSELSIPAFAASSGFRPVCAFLEFTCSGIHLIWKSGLSGSRLVWKWWRVKGRRPSREAGAQGVLSPGSAQLGTCKPIWQFFWRSSRREETLICATFAEHTQTKVFSGQSAETRLISFA